MWSWPGAKPAAPLALAPPSPPPNPDGDPDTGRRPSPLPPPRANPAPMAGEGPSRPPGTWPPTAAPAPSLDMADSVTPAPAHVTPAPLPTDSKAGPVTPPPPPPLPLAPAAGDDAVVGGSNGGRPPTTPPPPPPPPPSTSLPRAAPLSAHTADATHTRDSAARVLWGIQPASPHRPTPSRTYVTLTSRSMVQKAASMLGSGTCSTYLRRPRGGGQAGAQARQRNGTCAKPPERCAGRDGGCPLRAPCPRNQQGAPTRGGGGGRFTHTGHAPQHVVVNLPQE
jgi:hypothetical protein